MSKAIAQRSTIISFVALQLISAIHGRRWLEANVGPAGGDVDWMISTSQKEVRSWLISMPSGAAGAATRPLPSFMCLVL